MSRVIRLRILFFLCAIQTPGLLRADDANRPLNAYDCLQALSQSRPLKDAEKDPAEENFISTLRRLSLEVEQADPSKRERLILDGVTAAARKLDPKASSAKTVKRIYNPIAYLNNSAGKYQDAQALSASVLEADPADRDALINNASASYGLGNYNQALEDARRALALDSDDKTAISLMKLAEGRIKPRAALPEAGTGQAAVERGYNGMLQQINQVDKRRREPLPEATPKQAEALIYSAAAKIAVKDYRGAVAETDKLIAQDPSNEQAYYYRAAAHNLLGQYEDSVKDATQALSLNPTDNSARDARAWAFYRLGRLREAMGDANYSLEVDPQNAYAYANRGYTHEKLGDLGSMLTDLKMAATLNPQFEPTYRDAAIANHVAPEHIEGRIGPPQKPQRLVSEHARRNSFATVLASSVIGGILIGLGFVHVFSGNLNRKGATSLKEGSRISFAKPRAPTAIDATYEIGRTIGQGGMGVVYEACDRALKRTVAIKMLRPELQKDAFERDHFLQEARTVAALHHPAIVEIHSIVEDPAGLYLVFEFVDGKTVENLIAKRRRLGLREIKAILGPVCQALEYAHARGVVHRDLKPSNIMITTEGLVKVMDFGIARQAKDCLNKICGPVTTGAGTPHYMAPEQENGEVRRQSDVFSLGVCLYEMATGQRPYSSPAIMPLKLERRYAKPSSIVTSLPADFDALIDGALHPEPDHRIHSAKNFWELLSRIS